jgi:hypothetical protein
MKYFSLLVKFCKRELAALSSRFPLVPSYFSAISLSLEGCEWRRVDRFVRRRRLMAVAVWVHDAGTSLGL